MLHRKAQVHIELVMVVFLYMLMVLFCSSLCIADGLTPHRLLDEVTLP